MKKRRISTITILIIIAIIVVLVVLFMPKQRKASSKKQVNEISSPKDFKTIEEAVVYTGSTFIKQDNNRVYLNFKYPLYSNDRSNQKYYVQLISYIAKLRDYKDFFLIDEEKNINIEVDCDKSQEIIEDYKINSLSNYFGICDSNIAIKNYTKISDVSLNIQSSVINNVINNNWKFNGANIGSQDSSMDDYKIFFDEGYDVRVIENDFTKPIIYNIVFNSRYTSNVVNNINTKSTFEEIKNILGEPTFNKEDAGVIGYKSNKIYAFFSKKQQGIEISIYNVENVDTSKFAEAVSKFIDDKKYNLFIDEVFDIWPDPDVYETQDDYVVIKYSTKGIKLEFNTSNPSGLTIYSNFKGNITKDIKFDDVINKSKKLPNNVYFKNEDLVLESEMQRITRYTIDDNVNYGNNLFFVIPTTSQVKLRKLNFFSKDGKYPNFQVHDNVKNTLWADDTHFIYSVEKKGIFMIDVLTRKTTNITTGSSKYDIKGFKDGVLSYDDTSIKVNL